ncbi:hypothetical protein HYW87_00505 [Candidatus Roizmanbacteria bacterium]|nr:hypothetical protein [Candidatus Roizmanbacteria bacterium]
MDTFVTVLLLSIFLALGFGSWRDWFKPEFEEELDEKEIGWVGNKIVAIITWFFLLYTILICFVIIKTLWRLA